jgi:glycosyltransferase involved in cell wall biosynthesis
MIHPFSLDRDQPFISLAIPVYQSASILPELCARIDKIKVQNCWNLEVIFVEDGGKDQSFDVLCRLQKKYPYISCVRLSRNFGHQSALRTALMHCDGDYIAVMDDDLQDPPELLPVFFHEIEQGFDIIYGIRKKRKEVFWKVILYSLFYRILSKLSDVSIPLDSGDFSLMKRSVLESILLLEERTLFLRGIRSWVGWKHKGISYDRPERFKGDSGYTLKKLFSIALNGIVSFSFLPLRMISLFGLLGILLSVVYSIYILFEFFIYGVAAPGFVTISLFILIFGSFNLFSLGIIGEYLSKIYTETKKRPFSIIAESHLSPLKKGSIYERNIIGRRTRDQVISFDQSLL